MLRFNLANACELHKSLNPTWTLISTKILRDLHYRSITDEKAHKLVCWNCLYSAKKKTCLSSSYVSVKWKLQHSPPPPSPGKHPGHLTFLKIFGSNSPLPEPNAFFWSPPRGICQLKSPHPREFAMQGKKIANARGSAGGGAGCRWNWLIYYWRPPPQDASKASDWKIGENQSRTAIWVINN